jgi:hypothetical protein
MMHATMLSFCRSSHINLGGRILGSVPCKRHEVSKAHRWLVFAHHCAKACISLCRTVLKTIACLTTERLAIVFACDGDSRADHLENSVGRLDTSAEEKLT